MAAPQTNFPGLKERELIALGACVVCGKPQLGSDITFYKITISRGGFNRLGLERRIGLQMMLGGSDALARAMGPDEDLASIFDGPHDVFVHEQCAHRIGSVLELMPRTADEAVGDQTHAPTPAAGA